MRTQSGTGQPSDATPCESPPLSFWKFRQKYDFQSSDTSTSGGPCAYPEGQAHFALVPTQETIGERLRRLRQERRLTQHDIAAPGVSAQYISKVERGQRNASVKALRKLSDRLGVSAQYLETGFDQTDAERRQFRLDDLELSLRLREDPTDVEETLHQVLVDATAARDLRGETRARLSLGILASHRGDHAEAISRLEPAVGEPWVTALSHPDAFATLGRAYVAAERGPDAVVLFRTCLTEIEALRPVNDAAAARFAMYLACALIDLDLFDDARDAIDRALQHGRRSYDDPYTAMRLHWTNARLAASSGDLDTAQASINRAIGLLETIEDTTHLARAHILGAEIALWGDEHDVAADHLETAHSLLPPGSDIEDQAYLAVQEAFLAARTGEAATAIDLANNAIRMLAGTDDSIVLGQAHWALGEAFAAAGAISSARAAFIEAGGLIPTGSRQSDRLVEAWQRSVPSET